jgi:hypothetical protein
MLTLSSTEIRIVKAWSEDAASSPFPQEQNIVQRLKRNAANRSMTFSNKDVQVIQHWAEADTKGRFGGEQYLLELEAELIKKIESYLDDAY